MDSISQEALRAQSLSETYLDGCSGLIWDMDGTLINSATVVPDSFIATVHGIGGSVFSRDEVVALYSLGEPAAMLAHMLGRPASPGEVDRYHYELSERAHAAKAYPEVHRVLADLQGILPMAVFTGASLRAAEILLEATQLRQYFAVIVGGDQVRHPKPAPDGILRACGDLGLAPHACAYIGDATTDLEAAKRSGARALAAGWGHLFRPESTSGEIVVRTPGDLCSN
ncbi:Phosphoglycolate phosphatase [Arthrobacter sp. 9V]|uniref:HAD family hydrolase n=1 Tax=Arthrobacter sp. 9V TaxID=2653132 RepID=UPI0012F38818|nr:HAD-IA family hydrolase [Arthrobacter sp. 9V]VXC43640.1 Phosphoglycolate phosphatase [Arthrobacter sp. 9V]